MSKKKTDVSFIKLAKNDEDFKREVVEHGKENLLVGAPRRAATSAAHALDRDGCSNQRWVCPRSGRRLHRLLGPLHDAR